jgi:hypothetical protein|tara:strand:- start:236 stop:511 length:276 start_codon:yes stop_codon:yes gene_type:complete
MENPRNPEQYQPFLITDFGRNFKLSGEESKTVILVPRYGVWAHDPQNHEKEIVIDTNDDLEILLGIYGDLPVEKFDNEAFFRHVPGYSVDD